MAASQDEQSVATTQRYWDKLTAEFTKRHPDIKVEVTIHPQAAIDAEVRNLQRAKDLPDLVQGGSYVEPAHRGELYTAEQVTSTRTQAAFTTSLADAGSVQRQQFGLPFSANTRMFLYNTRLFDKAGLKEAPSTWKELRGHAAKLKDAGVRTPYGLPLGDAAPEGQALSWLLSGGGGYTDSSGTYVINSPSNISTFDWLQKNLVKEGLSYQEPGVINDEVAFQSFLEGDVAMINGDSSLARRAREKGIDCGLAIPPGRSGPMTVTAATVEWMMAFKQNGHREEIRTFLDYLYRDANVREYAEQHEVMPVTTAASDAMRTGKKGKELGRFFRSLETARFYPMNKRTWKPTLETLRKEIGQAVGGDGDPKGALSKIQQRAMEAEQTTGR
ncbi:extracellular solute-binding protein [Streptomyces sp. NPDC005438]|uniref:extracellular solute-binding protein n=1 Tax=Streptomyces sp. NPDC005438 TaxID=3156880 RepID=UPI0033B4EC3E